MQNKIQYKEGSEIEFVIKKQIELAEDEKYFVLEDAEGRKQLMKSKFYKKYNFKIGGKIICKIDHINCVGKIFLEPKHPYYKQGAIYNFVINEISKQKNRVGEEVLLIKVIDKLNNSAYCKIDGGNIEEFKTSKQIKCRVELIKKGILYLNYVNGLHSENFEIGKFYDFKIVAIKVLEDSFKYYVLKDKKNNTHILKYDYYNFHNLEIGQNIQCQIIKFSSEGYFIIEPRHPYYEIGSNYEFKFLSQKKDLLTNNFIVTVSDVFNQEVNFVETQQVESENVVCKVVGIKKGKPILVSI